MEIEAVNLHKNLLIADLHADPLLWARDLSREWTSGHFDLPRMEKANLALQVFGLVTKSPKGQNFHTNSAKTDQLVPLVIAQHWPVRTWGSTLQRALYQAHRLDNLANEHKDFKVIKSKLDLELWLKDRVSDSSFKAGLLAIEGAHALEGNLENYEELKNAGIRMIGLAHFFDNHFSGSAHGIKKHGLSEDGKSLVIKAQQEGILIDLAHVSTAAFDDVIAISTKPLVVSHTGVKATCDSPRNLTNKQIVGIGKTGGVIGIAIFKGATCGSTVGHMVDAIDHVVSLIGVDYVALGLDLDGAVVSPVDVTGMPLITQELLKRGYSERDIANLENNSMIISLGQWVINHACQQIEEWNLTVVEHPRISINISAKHFQYGDLIADVNLALKKYNMDPSQLILEITESSFIGDIDSAVKKIVQLNRLGVGVSIDDFGIGYSSFTYLSQLPIQELKIDRSFILELKRSQKQTALVEAIINIAHVFNLDVVAEGVEEQEVISILKDVGCDIVQGFYFSEPINSSSFTRKFLNPSSSNVLKLPI